MTAHATDGGTRSLLGEHLVVLLVLASLVLAALAAYPALASRTRGTASKVQERVDAPLVVASTLDRESPSSGQRGPQVLHPAVR